MKVSDAIAKLLSVNGVTVGFELIGGMIAHLVDSINLLGETRLISLHHEQAAAFAAGGVARATSNKSLGVALGTSGPGATNLVTGIADCWLDSHPCIFITGQVNTFEQKKALAVRQQGFQELDIVSIVDSITKYAYQIQTVDEVLPCLQKAINIAKTGRPGPVLLDIPMDLQKAELPDNCLDFFDENISVSSADTSGAFTLLNEEILASTRPLFLIGGGAVSCDSFLNWKEFIDKLSVPHVASLKGSGSVPASDCYFGMIGSYGTRSANYAIQNCDLLIVLGSRLDVRQTGSDREGFAKLTEKIVQIDIDCAQLNNQIPTDTNIHSSCEDFFKSNIGMVVPDFTRSPWLSWSLSLRQHWKKTFIDEYSELSLSPFLVCSALNYVFSKYPVHYAIDVGNNQMWAAHSLRLSSGQMAHHSGGLGAMGFALPTSIGVALSVDTPVIVITGDGGVQLNIQELDVISREKLPILTLVLNNESLGMVRSFQEMYFDGRNNSTYWSGFSTDYTELGRAYGIDARKVLSLAQFELHIKDFIAKPRPMLLELIMPDAIECRPRLTYGCSLDRQLPEMVNVDIL